MVARARTRMGGETELRGILKTFAILLIFFLKWVKLFYDFRRVPRPLPLFFPPPPPRLASPRLSFARRWWREPPLNLIHGRHRHVRGIVKSVIPSLSPPSLAPLRLPPVPSSAQPVPRPQPPFFPDLLCAILKVSAASFLALPLPTLSPSPPPGGNSFRELCGKFPLLPLLRTSSTSTLFQLPRQLIISFSMNPGDVDIGRLISSVRFIFFYYSLDGQTLPRSILLILRMEFLERIFFRIFMYKERVICWFVLDEFCIYFLFVLGGLG